MKFTLIDIEYCLINNKISEAQKILDILKPELSEEQIETISSGIMNFTIKSALNKIKENEKRNDENFVKLINKIYKEGRK